VTGFRPFFNAATGEWIEFIADDEDDGQLVRFSWRSVLGGVITEHVHRNQEERFIVTAGEALFTLDGRRSQPGRATPSSCPPESLIPRETQDRPRSRRQSRSVPR
jgi:hypothetical protein